MIIDYDKLGPTPAAWIGYDLAAFRRGELVINVCAECQGTREAEALAGIFKCKTFRTLCQKHIAERTAERTARLTGDKL